MSWENKEGKKNTPWVPFPTQNMVSSVKEKVRDLRK
jgi:hypothetical protein